MKNEIVFICFFLSDKKKSFIRFLGESMALKSAYSFIWPLIVVVDSDMLTSSQLQILFQFYTIFKIIEMGILVQIRLE